MPSVPERLTLALADHYLIERELGQGGMATVYLAEDVRHRRRVALKVLRPELAAVIGAERFLKEIEVTANLQHPHILPLHDSGAADSFLFYVMPYVEGESLRARLERERQLGITEAVELARQAASALDYAHRHGVIHRDIKPENILIHDRQALIADFGIALAVSTAGGSRMTETGMSLGTPHYMSPEQAMGDRAVDARSDVYALGCVLYEMLVGEPPFTGPTAQAIVAKVITEKAPLVTAARETTPPHLAAAIQKALAKLPADRFASAAEFAEALVNPQFTWTPVTTGALPAARIPQPVWRRALPWVGCIAGAALAFWLGGRLLAPPSPSHPAVRTTLSFGGPAQPRDAGGSPLALSPDGSRLLFLGVDSQRTGRIYVRELDRPVPVAVAGTEAASQPFVSPDGQWVGFAQENKLRKVALSGGAVVTITEIGNFQGGSWGGDGRIVYSTRNRLFRVAAAGGTPELLAEPDSSARERLTAYRWPELLPGDQAVVFTMVHDQPTLAVLSLSDKKIKELGQPGMSPRYVEPGYLVFGQTDGTVFAAPFDARQLRFIGPPQPIAQEVRTGPASVAKMAVSRSGTLAYLSGPLLENELVMVDNRGRPQQLGLLPQRYGDAAFSPDGKRLAFSIRYSGPPTSADLWTMEFGRGTLTRLTFDSSSGAPRWSPDGRRILFTRRTGGANYGLFSLAPDGSGTRDTLLLKTGINALGQLTRDGKYLVFQHLEGAPGANANWDLWVAPVDTPSAARPLLQNPFSEFGPALSPDGQWLAYVSNETGESVVYLRRLFTGTGRLRVSVGGGNDPNWSPDGRELFYRFRDSIYAVPITRGKELGIGTARARFGLPSGTTEFTIHPDGRRVLFIRDQPRQSQDIELILNWFEQPQRRP